jgi:hypothetical protein
MINAALILVAGAGIWLVIMLPYFLIRRFYINGGFKKCRTKQPGK